MERSVNDLINPPNLVKKTLRQINFEKQRMDWSDRDIQIANLYQNQLLLEMMDRVRRNTSTIVWTFIFIPAIITVTLFFLSILGLGS